MSGISARNSTGGGEVSLSHRSQSGDRYGADIYVICPQVPAKYGSAFAPSLQGGILYATGAVAAPDYILQEELIPTIK